MLAIKDELLQVWRNLSVRFMLQVPLLASLLAVIHEQCTPTFKCNKLNSWLIYQD